MIEVDTNQKTSPNVIELGLFDFEGFFIRWWRVRFIWRVLLMRRLLRWWITLLVVGILVFFLPIVLVVWPVSRSRLYLILLIVARRCSAHLDSFWIGLHGMLCAERGKKGGRKVKKK